MSSDFSKTITKQITNPITNPITTVGEVSAAIEEFAPLAAQASYDNSGLIVGRPTMLVSGVLLAVDLTEEVLSEALAEGCNMIITHHPIIFSPLKRLNSASYIERCVERAIRHDVAIYAAHTNLDSAVGGMSWHVGKVLGLNSMRVLEPQSAGSDVGFGVVGELSEATTAEAFIDRVAERFRVEVVRHSEIAHPSVSRIAVCTGSGGGLLDEVVASGCDLYVTADLRYNTFLDAQKCVTVVDIGHFESEYCAIEILNDLLSKKMINFAVRASRKCANPVHYRKYDAEQGK